MSNKNDMFAPPSEQEVNDVMFAAPTANELTVAQPVIEEPQEKNTKGQSFLKGAGQGATLGFADEAISGTTAAVVDPVHALLNKLGIVESKSPSQTLEQFNQPNSVEDIYKGMRDTSREDFKQAEKDHPGYSLAGNLAGGILTAPLMPAALTTPFKSAEGATRLAKVGTAVANSLPLGAIIGEGITEGNTVGDQGEDIAKSMAFGGGATGLLSGAGQVLNKVGTFAGKHFPTIPTAYELGTEGINTTSKEFPKLVNNKLQNFTNTLGDFFKTKRDVNTRIHEKSMGLIDDSINQIENNLKDKTSKINQQLEDTLGSEKTSLLSNKEADRQLLQKQMAVQAVKTQKELGQVKDKVGKIYNTLENDIKDKNITFNVNDDISQFGEDLQRAGLQPDEANTFTKKFNEEFEKGDLSLNELRNVKNKLTGLFDSGKPEVRKAAKMSYGRINDRQSNILEQSGSPELAQSMREANTRYKAILGLEDDFIGQIKPDKITQQVEPATEGLKTIKAFSSSKPKAEDFIAQDQLQRMATQADPEFAQQLLQDYQKLGSKIKANDAINPDVLNKSSSLNINDIKLADPSYQNLIKEKDLLTTAVKPKDQVEKLMNSSEFDTEKYLRDNLRKIKEPVDSSGKSNIQNVLADYKRSKGKDLTPDVEKFAKQADLLEEVAQGTHGVSFRSAGGIKTIGRDVANIMGRLQRHADPNARIYENQLAEAARKTGTQSYDALMFSLMQQPKFRKLIGKDKTETDDGK